MTQACALVTGASAGIGQDIAMELAARGYRLILVARRLDRLEEFAEKAKAQHGVETHCIAQDLGVSGGPKALAEAVEARGWPVEVLVNNAGFGLTGPFHELDLERQLGMLQLNVVSLTELTGLFVRQMVGRKRGYILNVGSLAGFQPGPNTSVYYATKAFVNSFTEALAHELKGTGVKACVSCPGATRSEFSEVAGNGESILFKMGAAEPKGVAKHAVDSLFAGRVISIPGALNKLMLQSLRVSPRGLIRTVTAKMND